jgi:hypothetical protein
MPTETSKPELPAPIAAYFAADPAVTARVIGDFPGSPVVLRYRFFTLERDKIARLEIAS